MNELEMSKELSDLPETTYYSERDTWIVAVLWASIIFCSAAAIYITFLQMSILLLVSQELLFLGVVALCFSILRSTYYTMKADELFVRSGPFKWSIPYLEIEKVVPERNLWSSAALSRDRLHITHTSSKTGSYISPEKEEAFMLDLAGRCPDLRLDGLRLIRVNEHEANIEDD